MGCKEKSKFCLPPSIALHCCGPSVGSWEEEHARLRGESQERLKQSLKRLYWLLLCPQSLGHVPGPTCGARPGGGREDVWLQAFLLRHPSPESLIRAWVIHTHRSPSLPAQSVLGHHPFGHTTQSLS